MDAIRDLLFDHTLRTVAMGAGIIGITAGVLGVFAVLRRQSLLGDAISHAALPGVALAFLFTLSKQPLVLILGALAAGWLAALLVSVVTRTTRIKSDSALGIVLAVFFGIGMVLLTYIQNLATARQAGLDKFLFGNAATMLTGDVITMGILGAVALVLVALFWKELKLLTFDYQFAQAQGWPVFALDVLLTTLIVLAIVIGLQAVGVVLMSALLIAPAVAARQWTDNLSVVVILAAVFGVLSGIGGAITSAGIAKLPTGPTIVLFASTLVLLSLFFAPSRGLFWAHLRHRRQHREVQVSAVLLGLWRQVEFDSDPLRPHSVGTLDLIGLHAEQKTLPLLASRGWIEIDNNFWHFTDEGINEAHKQLAAAGDDR